MTRGNRLGRELKDLAQRLQSEYGPRFLAAGAEITIGSTGSGIAAEILWGGRIGRGLYHRERLGSASQRGVSTDDIDELEARLRSVFTEWLQERKWAQG